MSDDVDLVGQDAFDHTSRRVISGGSIDAMAGLLAIIASKSPSLAMGRRRWSGCAASLVSRYGG